MFVRHTQSPSLPPPVADKGIILWLRTNLFSSITNTLLTVLGLYLVYLIVPPFLKWAIFDANFAGWTREDCVDTVGACWVFIKVRFPLLMYGFYPEPERWRIDFIALLMLGNGAPLLLAPFLPFSERVNKIILAAIPSLCALYIVSTMGIVVGIVGLLFLGLPFVLVKNINGYGRFFDKLYLGNLGFSILLGLLASVIVHFAGLGGEVVSGFLITILSLLFANLRKATVGKWQFWFIYGVLPCLAWIFFLGGSFGLNLIGTDQWGGLFLTLVISLFGVATSLPIGILLALGRNSNMPVVKVLCISFIEFARGVPLISVLFMVSVMLPMMLPQGMYFDKLLRALLGISLFYAAYMAEVVRGGLQAIPRGQYEAANALGLPFFTQQRLIIMPQALRLVIPGITNTYLGLMKDTTLVAVINLMDIIGIMKSALADTEWLGFTKEAYFFAGLIFWLMCFVISRYSLYLERKLSWKRK